MPSAESPGQRVAAAIVGIGIEGAEARSFGQVVARADAVTQRGIAPLQEGDGGVDGAEVGVAVVEKVVDRGGALGLGQLQSLHLDSRQPFSGEQAQHERQGQILLHRIDPARAQEARQVRRRGVRRVELRHRGIRERTRMAEVGDMKRRRAEQGRSETGSETGSQRL